MAVAVTTTTAATATDGKVDAEADCLLNDVSRGGIIYIFDARTKGTVRLWLGEEHGREETAHFSAGGRYGVARVQGEGVRAPVEETREPAFDLADGGRNE
jgi:hypothetical protein